MLTEHERRLLAHMQRAPGGNYTAAQLARNTGISLAEAQNSLTRLEREGYVVRSEITTHLAFRLTERGTQTSIAAHA